MNLKFYAANRQGFKMHFIFLAGYFFMYTTVISTISLNNVIEYEEERDGYVCSYMIEFFLYPKVEWKLEK